jgi:hypothetical protein
MTMRLLIIVVVTVLHVNCLAPVQAALSAPTTPPRLWHSEVVNAEVLDGLTVPIGAEVRPRVAAALATPANPRNMMMAAAAERL